MMTRQEKYQEMLLSAEEAAQNAILHPDQEEFYLKSKESYLKMAQDLFDEVQQLWCDFERLKDELRNLIDLFDEKCN